MNTQYAKFYVGQLIHHKLFAYRGVIIDVDPEFQGTDEWYEQVAQSRPPRDQPWYHVLVHNATHNTYVAERHLEDDESQDPINHPYLSLIFDSFQNGVYINRNKAN